MHYPRPVPTERLKRISELFNNTLIGGAIDDVLRMMQPPPEMVLPVALSTVSAIVQTKVKVDIPRIGIVPTSLFVLIEALTNERKSAVNRILTRAMVDFERDVNQQRQKKYAELNDDESTKKGKQNSKKEGPPLFQLFLKDSTGEGTLKAITAGNWSLYQDVDEGAKFFRWLDTPMYCTSWSGDRHVVNRASTPSFVLDGSCMTVCVLIQPGRMEKVLGRHGEQLLDSGFLGRTLYSRVNSTQGYRTIDPYAKDTLDSDPIKRFHERSTELLNEASHENPEAPPEREVMDFDPVARVRLLHFYNEMEQLMAPGQVLHDVREFVGKATENAGRLAANLCHFETKQMTITERWVDLAIEVMYYFMDQAKARFGSPSDQERIGLIAEDLLVWISNQVRVTNQEVTISILQRMGPAHLRQRDQLHPAIEFLLHQGRLVRHQRGRLTTFGLGWSPMGQNPWGQNFLTATRF